MTYVTLEIIVKLPTIGFALIVILAVSSCAPAPPAAPPTGAEPSLQAGPPRTLVLVGRSEREVVWPAAQARDTQLRNTAPGLTTTSGPAGEGTLVDHARAEIPRPENRWTGSNRGGWSNPEFDRLAQAFSTTLARAERTQLLVQLAHVFSDDAAVISLYFNPTVTAHAKALTGPRAVVPTSDVAWDIHKWEFH
jgi:hypothetical protein